VTGGAPSKLGWYARRLGRMSPAEMAWRAREQAQRRAWRSRQVLPGQTGALSALTANDALPSRQFTSVLPPEVAARVPEAARAAIIAAADRLLKGEWEMLGAARTDMVQPDWFWDPVTGRRSSPETYAFSLNQRDEGAVGNIKQVWEISRLQHLTLLATAWFLTAEDAYAQRVADQLRSWLRDNPFLSGVNWTSGIELGVRLINLAWIRRLLDSWPGVIALFERSETTVRQIRWHQEYLAAFESRGSSANNHVIAEAAGQLVASCAFPWFPESGRWRRESASLLARSLADNTFPSGVNRELASDYHGFVFELGLFAAVEASAAGTPLDASTWGLLCSMADAMAALVDVSGRPPRQGDSDEGRVVLLDAPEHNRWPALLALGDGVFGRLPWWPSVVPDAGSVFAAALLDGASRDGASRDGASRDGASRDGASRADGGAPRVTGRPAARPDRFADAGISILRTDPADSPELWVRCDGGPHGFLSIAAHAHADALSVEVRFAGVDILADPGTYCYHGEPEWRSYFQSTIGHNTVEVGGAWQSVRGGAFLWLRPAAAREVETADDGVAVSWTAEHDGYLRLRPPARHRRSVRIERAARLVEIEDAITGPASGDGGPAGFDVRVAFHLGPDVTAALDGAVASLAWPDAATPGTARLELPDGLRWSAHRGETEPILGWYSAGLGHRVPAVTLLGQGRCLPGSPLVTRLKFEI
jgi:Heparinase II/III-like protein/Heparinase II/III N-terminus